MQFTKDDLEIVGDLTELCAQIVLTCPDLARIGRQCIIFFNIAVLRSVDALARAVTKWNRACDKRMARLFSFLQCTSDYRQTCHVGNKGSECKPG